MAATICHHAPDLLARNGVGPDTAAALLIAAGDNPGRLHSEVSLAALCGVSPVEASSGKTQRQRLNRGGNRQATAALRRITLSRLRWDQATRGATEREVLAKHAELREAQRHGQNLAARRYSLGEWLDEWLAVKQRQGTRATTREPTTG